MPVKSFREMTNRQRKRHSLSARAVRALLVFSIFMGVIALTFGFHLYTGTVVRDYRTDTWHTDRNMAAPDRILENVKDAVKAFTGDAKQFDDITMLCLRYNGVQTGSDQ